MTTSFEANIKPYFSEYDRDSMNDPNHTGGYTVDLWSRDDVHNYYAAIKDAIDRKKMPPGGWPDDQIKAFDADFEAWHQGGFQP
ncbi:MAG: hypothetical protein JWM21_1895 [Acidobacteria bacterium]|nr:hypothetical protein [Acidobacteriota bacterium]